MHGLDVRGQVARHFGAQVDVHADGPAQLASGFQNSHDFAVFGRNQQQGPRVQDARGLLLQQGHDALHAVVAVGNTLTVKPVAGLALVELHHGQ